jgi:hypothetical protein
MSAKKQSHDQGQTLEMTEEEYEERQLQQMAEKRFYSIQSIEKDNWCWTDSGREYRHHVGYRESTGKFHYGTEFDHMGVSWSLEEFSTAEEASIAQTQAWWSEKMAEYDVEEAAAIENDRHLIGQHEATGEFHYLLDDQETYETKVQAGKPLEWSQGFSNIEAARQAAENEKKQIQTDFSAALGGQKLAPQVKDTEEVAGKPQHERGQTPFDKFTGPAMRPTPASKEDFDCEMGY